GEEFGVAGIGEAGAVEGGFVDRVGDHGGGLAGEGELRCLFDGGDDGGRVGGIGATGDRGCAEADGQDREGVAEDGTGGAGGVHRADGNVEAEGAGDAGEAVRIVHGD